MKIETENIRSYRLKAHHLEKKLPLSGLADAAGACGVQNSPPGAWETAMFNRLEGCSLPILHDALYEKKILLQAWSVRGVPLVFPTDRSGVFLTALLAQEGEQPWIYTRGITAALDYMQMSFDDLLMRTKQAAGYLNSHTVRSKETLDQTLADIIECSLTEEKRALWRAPSMYGNPDRQTVGGAAVSFLLRPCSFSSLIVFGRRQGITPTFTSFQNWTGRRPEELAFTEEQEARKECERELVRTFLHCYGPSGRDSFMGWLGCSGQQARRLWSGAKDEMEPVQTGKKTCYMLSNDMEALAHSQADGERLLLLGAHDPYLDIKDRDVLLEDRTLQKAVWKTVGNPGVILKAGRIAGIWRTKTLGDKLETEMTLFEALETEEKNNLKELAEEYARFRGLALKKCVI